MGTSRRRPEAVAIQRDGDRIAKLCTQQGLRMTGQRRVIARVLSEAHDHPDVEDVHRRANAHDGSISMSTVYRTLRLFAERGILEHHAFGAGRRRYEQGQREHHDHLIDVETGRVIEFRDEDIEKIQERIARELGFRLVGHRLELFGVPAQKTRKSGK